MQIFIHSHYIDVIKEVLSEFKAVKGYQTKLADACRCHRSFFSQVLRRRHDLSLEQAMRLSRFVGMSSDECEYFLTLVQHEKASSPELKTYFAARMNEQREKQKSISARFDNSDKFESEFLSQYYSNPMYLTIHALTSIDTFGEVDTIAKRLGCERKIIKSYLSELEAWGVVEHKNKLWKAKHFDLHLPQTHIMNLANQVQWRVKAIDAILARKKSALNYSSIMALSKRDFEILKVFIGDLIKNSREKALESQAEDIFCLNIDAFEV